MAFCERHWFHVNVSSLAVACGGSIALKHCCLVFSDSNYSCGLRSVRSLCARPVFRLGNGAMEQTVEQTASESLLRTVSASLCKPTQR